MKLVVATPLFPPDSGGPATDAALLCAELPENGIEVSVYSFGDVRHLPKGVSHARYAYELFKRARASDGIVALDTFSVCLPAALVAWLLQKPLIIRVPGDYVWEQATQRFGVTDSVEVFQKKRYGFEVEAMRWLQQCAARSAALVVVPSDYFRSIVQQWGIAPEKLQRIYLGINLTDEATPPSNAPEDKILFSLGRFVPWKGFPMLIDLMPELPGWHLVIAGDGPLRTVLEAQVRTLDLSERVTFTGAIPRTHVLGWYRRADAFALNTSFESFSFQVLEAMLSEVPVITTKVGSLPELITNGVEGVLCVPDDKTAFKEAILSVERDPQQWKLRSNAARRKASGFSDKVSVSAFAQAVKEICV